MVIAYAAPATESRSELVGQKINAKEERYDLDKEEERVDNRRFRNVKISGTEEEHFRDIKLSKKVSREDSEKRSEKKSRSSINVPYRWG